LNPANGEGEITTVREILTGEQTPTGVTVFTTVYEPGAEAAKLITPVNVFTNTNPAGDEENTPEVPVTVGVGFVPVTQNGEPV